MNVLLSKKKFNQYQKDISICRNKGGELASKCVEDISLQYLRDIPGMKNMVYPWINYDWNYDIYVDNKYNKSKTGATPKGTMSALFKNPIAMKKLLDGFTFNANPSNNSKAGTDDLNQCNGDKHCELINNIRKKYLLQTKPYDDEFFNKKLDGEMSSSYFIKTGTCPKPKLTKKQCKEKGYSWIENPLYTKTPSFLRPDTFKEGVCYKNKYGYIKNNSGLEIKIPKINSKFVNKDAQNISNKGINLINDNIKKFKGALPSFTNDILSLSPNNIYKVLKGEDNNYLTNMKCETFINCCDRDYLDDMDSFCNYKKIIGITNEQYFIMYLSLSIFIMLLIIIIKFKY